MIYKKITNKKEKRKREDWLYVLLVNLLINCLNIFLETRYQVIRYIAQQFFNFKLTKNKENWDVFWTDSVVSDDFVANMKPY